MYHGISHALFSKCRKAATYVALCKLQETKLALIDSSKISILHLRPRRFERTYNSASRPSHKISVGPPASRDQ